MQSGKPACCNFLLDGCNRKEVSGDQILPLVSWCFQHCSALIQEKQIKQTPQNLPRHFSEGKCFNIHKLPLITKWSLGRKIRDRRWLFLARFLTFGLFCTGAQTLALQNISILIPGLEEIIGSLEEIIASMENPHMQTNCLILSRHRKTSNMYNLYSPFIQQTHWKILIQILTVTLWRLFSRKKKSVSYNLTFFKTSFTKVWRYMSIIFYFKRSLPGPSTEQPHLPAFIQGVVDYICRDFWILVTCLNMIFLVVPNLRSRSADFRSYELMPGCKI